MSEPITLDIIPKLLEVEVNEHGQLLEAWGYVPATKTWADVTDDVKCRTHFEALINEKFLEYLRNGVDAKTDNDIDILSEGA